MRAKELLIVSLVSLTSACSYPQPAPPAHDNNNVSLTRNLEMTDHNGHYYGNVELDPVGGGRVYDADGRLIGTIISPVH